MSGLQPGSRPALVLLRVVGPILMVGMIVIGSFAVVTSFFRQTERETTTLRGDIRYLVVGTNVGDIRVHPVEAGATSTLSASLTWSYTRPTVSTALVDGELTVNGRCGHGPITSGYCSVDLDISIPAATTVTVRSSTGDLSLFGLTGTVQATTSTGDISLQTLRSTDVSATTSTGDVAIVLVNPPNRVHARTSVGDITVVVPADGTPYRVDAVTSTGSKTLHVPTDSGASRSLDLTTSTGDITLRTSGSSR